jgi:hypothetical protein
LKAIAGEKMMRIIVMSRPLANWLGIAFSIALWFVPVNGAIAQSQDTSAYIEAISRLEQFKQDLSGMRSVVGQTLGPYPINTQCTWCSEYAWWGLGLCTENTTQTWGLNVDFTWTRQSLAQLIEQAQQNASRFNSSYAPTQAWINGLPEFSQKFDSTVNTVLAVREQIRAGVGPDDQQRMTVTQALQEASRDLDSSMSLLQSGTSSIAAFLQQQSDYREAIQRAIAGADQSAQSALANIENESRRQRCQDGLDAKYTGIKADFSRSIQSIAGAFQSLEGSSRSAEKGLALLLGSVVSNQTELKTVLNLVRATSNDQLGSFLEKLHLNAAQQQWRDLAKAL